MLEFLLNKIMFIKKIRIRKSGVIAAWCSKKVFIYRFILKRRSVWQSLTH